MGDRPLHCSIKNPITLTVEDQKNVFHSGCKVIDVTFPNVSTPEVKLKMHLLSTDLISLIFMHYIKQSINVTAIYTLIMYLVSNNYNQTEKPCKLSNIYTSTENAAE